MNPWLQYESGKILLRIEMELLSTIRQYTEGLIDGLVECCCNPPGHGLPTIWASASVLHYVPPSLLANWKSAEHC